MVIQAREDDNQLIEEPKVRSDIPVATSEPQFDSLQEASDSNKQDSNQQLVQQKAEQPTERDLISEDLLKHLIRIYQSREE